ncbi:MAG TPA: hypothetical protein GXX75_23020 [Clostridiales bacterium]|nr:hypothetical protein [Clostridiales bacterium]
MVRNSIKQMLRMPVRGVSFLLLIAASGMLLTLGAVLWITDNSLVRSYEDTFITIGTVEQKAFSVQQVTRWDAERKDYQLRQKAVYSKLLPVSLLFFEGADYIHEPEKRSYYGSYAPDYTLVSKVNNAELATVVAEISPLEDCIPDESVKVRVNKVFFGSPSLEGTSLWFCNHHTQNPKPLQKEKSYAVVLILHSWAHGAHYEAEAGAGARTLEYIPGETAAIQYGPDGMLMKDSLEREWAEDSPYYEVTDGFYDTDIGQRLLNAAKGLYMYANTQPVTGTNATILLMPFYNGDAYISEGRDIGEEEYKEGKQVCLVPRKFAENNSLTLGSMVHLRLYYTNNKNTAGQFFRPDGSGGGQGLLIDVNGKTLSVFEDSQYTIVGIYDISYGADQGSYSMGGDEIIVPVNSIKNRDARNIIAYGPMMGYTTSFQIPNGSIEKFLAAWEKYGTEELEITFYDMGYSQIKSGLENRKHMSLVLLVVGLLMVSFLLLFYSHLFITNQKKRTAIERCLGMEKKKCRRSLLSGMLILLLAGSTLGCSLGGVLSRHISIDLNQVYYDASYSSVADVKAKDAPKVGSENTVLALVTSLSATVFIILFGVGISIIKIDQNLKLEPMELLSEKRRE